MDNQPAWWRCISSLIWAKTCIFPSMLWLCMLYIQIRIYESPVYVPSRCHRSINRNSYIICVKKSEIFLSCGLYTSINHNQNAQLLVSGVTWWTMCQISDEVWKLSVTLKKKNWQIKSLDDIFRIFFCSWTSWCCTSRSNLASLYEMVKSKAHRLLFLQHVFLSWLKAHYKAEGFLRQSPSLGENYWSSLLSRGSFGQCLRN